MSEHDEQCALFEWAERMEERLPALRLLHAIPNGAAFEHRQDSKGRRYSPEGQRMRKSGLKSGVPDICLPVPGRYVGDDWHGLYIEMKTKRGRQSKEQREWRQLLYEQGYYVYVGYSWWAAACLIVRYLGQRPVDYGLDAAAAMEAKA